MRATGIIRRVDDLGRIVIPKVIRRRMGILEGTPMELFIEGDKLIFQKYDCANEIKVQLDKLESVLREEASLSGVSQAMEHIEALKEIFKEN